MDVVRRVGYRGPEVLKVVEGRRARARNAGGGRRGTRLVLTPVRGTQQS